MKRFFAFSLILAMGFGLAAFQCSSTEITSAKLYIQQKQYDKAKEALKREVEKNPKSDEGYWYLGFLYGEEGEFDLMIDAFEKSTGISNKFAPNIMDSRKYHWASNFNKGVSYFNKASKTTNQDSINMFFEMSIEAFDNAIMCEPDSVASYSNLAFAYINMKKNDEAVPIIEKEIALSKKNFGLSNTASALDEEKHANLADSYALIGELLTKLGASAEDESQKNEYFEKAIMKLKEGKEYFPNNPDILLHLSNAYIATDQMDVAMEAFREGVEKEPENKYYRFNYGSMLLNLDKFDEATEQLVKAVELDPEYENAIYNLAVTYVKWGAILREEAVKNEAEDDESYKEKYEMALPYLKK